MVRGWCAMRFYSSLALHRYTRESHEKKNHSIIHSSVVPMYILYYTVQLHVRIHYVRHNIIFYTRVWGARILVLYAYIPCTGYRYLPIRYGLFPRKTNYWMWRKLYFSGNNYYHYYHCSWFRFSFGARNRRVHEHTRTCITIIKYIIRI